MIRESEANKSWNLAERCADCYVLEASEHHLRNIVDAVVVSLQKDCVAIIWVLRRMTTVDIIPEPPSHQVKTLRLFHMSCSNVLDVIDQQPFDADMVVVRNSQVLALPQAIVALHTMTISVVHGFPDPVAVKRALCDGFCIDGLPARFMKAIGIYVPWREDRSMAFERAIDLDVNERGVCVSHFLPKFSFSESYKSRICKWISVAWNNQLRDDSKASETTTNSVFPFYLFQYFDSASSLNNGNLTCGLVSARLALSIQQAEQRDERTVLSPRSNSRESSGSGVRTQISATLHRNQRVSAERPIRHGSHRPKLTQISRTQRKFSYLGAFSSVVITVSITVTFTISPTSHVVTIITITVATTITITTATISIDRKAAKQRSLGRQRNFRCAGDGR